VFFAFVKRSGEQGLSPFVALRSLVLVAALVLLVAAPTLAETFTFQQGANGYERAQDTTIRWAYATNFGDSATIESDNRGDPGAYNMWSTNGGRTSILEVGQFFQSTVAGFAEGVFTTEAGPVYRYSRMYIRFRDVFGTGANQIPPEGEISSATLKLYNTEDQGAVVAVGAGVFPDIVPSIDGISLANPKAEPKLNGGNIAVYPSLIPITYGFDDGMETKGRVTARDRRLLKQGWSQGPCLTQLAGNDPIAMAFNCGPADVDDPEVAFWADMNDAVPGEPEIDSRHPGAIEVFQDASEGFKEFDVLGLIDFITGDGVYMTALSAEGALPTMDINYGNAYRSSEFGNIYDADGNLVAGASNEQIATRPIFVIELGGSTVSGDVNGDGLVDVADLGIVGANFGSHNAVPADGDFNRDGVIDVADLGILGANWSASQSTGTATALVPEPTTLSLLAMSMLVVGRRRR